MKTRFKTSLNSQKQAILENSNFLNNQNYILGKSEKKNILINMKNIDTEYFHRHYWKLYKRDLYNYKIYDILTILKIFFLISLILIFILILVNLGKVNSSKELWSTLFIFFLIIYLSNYLLSDYNRKKKITNYNIYKNKEYYYYYKK